MIWELQQQHRISQASNKADEAKWKADRYSSDISKIEGQIERLSIACQAMWELLRENTEIEESDLDKKIHEIDIRDGHENGKMSIQTLNCTSCGRPTNSKREICLICGAPLKKPHQFEV